MYEFFKDFAGPMATVLASLAAAYVAYSLGSSQTKAAQMQADVAKSNWETANERIVLELFERRFAIYDNVRKVVSNVLRTGSPTDEDYFEYCRAIDTVRFYFDTEVQEYLETVRKLIIDLQLDGHVINDATSPDRTAHIKGRTERMKELTKFYEISNDLFGPYIRAHQKVTSWSK